MPNYSPERRTAVVLSGTGAHGAYHAGALRALQEAGVKVDLVAGHGVGAAGAAVAAIDGGARLWDAGGVWAQPAIRTLYPWTRLIRRAGWLALALVCVLFAPVLVLVSLALVVYPIAFLLQTVGADAGTALMDGFTSWLQAAFSGPNLPTFIPRVGMIVLAMLVTMVAIGSATARRAKPQVRRAAGPPWWRIVGAPIDTESAKATFADAVWQLIRGAAPAGPQPLQDISRRYTDVLRENLGQPGFRDVIMIATDLDGRRDLVAALLREPYRTEFMAAQADRDRRAEVLDLSESGRDRALDVMAGALTPPMACEPHRVTFSADSYWRGETHRLCDRPGSISRLLEEVAAAGATQVIVVAASGASSGPHRLPASRLDVRSRLGEFLVGAESAALRDAFEMARLRFDGVYLIRPAHNPVGPFDFAGTYDSTSDRQQDLQELMAHAYDDAYRQFIEPIVGASGEHLAHAEPGAGAGNGQGNGNGHRPASPRATADGGRSGGASWLFEDVDISR
jgi:hypothetical protein